MARMSMNLVCILSIVATVHSQTDDLTAADLNTAPAPSTECAAYWGGQTTPELTQGPYYLEEDLFRQNITEGQAGVPLELRITILDTDCTPLDGVFVDIWHANATGEYSGFAGAATATGTSGAATGGAAEGPSAAGGAMPFTAPNGTMGTAGAMGVGAMGAAPPMASGGSSGPGAGGGGMSNGGGISSTQTDNLTFLRGTVMSDEDGLAVIDTIVPGWYSGRAVHVHTMMHIPYNTSSNITVEYEASHEIHTGQFFFPEAVLTDVAALEPYVQHNSTARTPNSEDGIYGNDIRQLLSLTEVMPGNISAGLVGDIVAIVNPGAAYTIGFSIGGSAQGATPPTAGTAAMGR